MRRWHIVLLALAGAVALASVATAGPSSQDGLRSPAEANENWFAWSPRQKR